MRLLSLPSSLLVAAAVALAGCGGGGGGGGGALPTTPQITSQPASVETKLGQKATFSVAARGKGTLSYQWYKDGAGISGATGSTYTVNSVAASSVGAYKVLVESDNGNQTTSHNAYLSLDGTAPPSITTQPTPRAAAIGRSVTFSVVAVGTQPFTYQWRKNGANIANATKATFTVSSVKAGDVGAYSVVVTNSEGSVTSDDADLTLVVLPTITTQPASAEVNEDTPVTFTVAATGGNLLYQWYRNGIGLMRQNSATLVVPAANATTAGTYTVKVSNAAGSVTSAGATLTVHLRPTIVTQPEPQRVPVNGRATLSVAATGEGTLTYQWYLDGVEVAGATGTSFTTAPLPLKPNGSPYQALVRVTNAIGTRTSRTVRIDVG